jgi:tRNA-dihydrouridine synthase A
MVSTGALIHGDVARHLAYNPEEQPLALQLGGSDPNELAHCSRLAEQWGYAEVNLNCGCPSERVQRGAFGACLMNEPSLVANCVKAMVDAADVDVTVKHRIGIGKLESYGFVRDFVGHVSLAGCHTFIVHARNAWLQGISPKDNREIPPLRYEMVYQLKRDFPGLTIVLNGGVTTTEQVQQHLLHVDGVMLGREAYHNPWWLSVWDASFYRGQIQSSSQKLVLTATREAIEEEMVDYMLRQQTLQGTAWPTISRHMLGLRNGLPGARRWRQVWSDHKLKVLPADQVMALACGESSH